MKCETTNPFEAGREALGRDLARLVGGLAQGERFQWFHSGPAWCDGLGRVTGPESVDLYLCGLTLEMARAILEVLTGVRQAVRVGKPAAAEMV
jgi:hypothetical protein